jgi:hypothetical protein
VQLGKAPSTVPPAAEVEALGGHRRSSTPKHGRRRRRRGDHDAAAGWGVGDVDRAQPNPGPWTRRIAAGVVGCGFRGGSPVIVSREPLSSPRLRRLSPGAQIDIAAEREAMDVADAVALTEKSVVAAALMAARSCVTRPRQKGRRRRRCGSRTGRHRGPDCCWHRVRADALAAQVATAAVKAAEAVSASTVSVATLKPPSQPFASPPPSTLPRPPRPMRRPWQQGGSHRGGRCCRTSCSGGGGSSSCLRVRSGHAAAAVRMIATTTARDLAVDTDAKAVEVALVARRSSQF